MSTLFWGVLVVLLTLYLLIQIVNDTLWGKKKFFSFFDVLRPSERAAYITGSFLFVLSLWSLISSARIVEPEYLPTPADTVKALWVSFASGELITNMAISLARVAVGFALASLIGITSGSIAGTFPRFGSLILPLNSAVRYIPPTAFIGLTIIWFGIGETSKIALIFLAIVFYVNQMVADTVALVPKTYIEAAQVLGAKRWEVFYKVVLSMSVPDLLAVLRINLGAAWTFLIVAELVAAQKGLGYLMAVSQRFLQTPKLFAMIFVVGVLGFVSDTFLAFAISRYSKWK